MTDKKKLENVFKTVGLPPYTYVKPAHYGEVRADVAQPGKHLLIEGPSGVGKTCVAFKAFEELNWTQGTDYSYVSCRDLDAEDAVREFFGTCEAGGTPTPAVIVIDDFHLLTVERRAEIGAILKRMSDRAFERHSDDWSFPAFGCL
jgi:hypothetical protein